MDIKDVYVTVTVVGFILLNYSYPKKRKYLNSYVSVCIHCQFLVK